MTEKSIAILGFFSLVATAILVGIATSSVCWGLAVVTAGATIDCIVDGAAASIARRMVEAIQRQ